MGKGFKGRSGDYVMGDTNGKGMLIYINIFNGGIMTIKSMKVIGQEICKMGLGFIFGLKPEGKESF